MIFRLALVLGFVTAFLVPSWYFARYEARSQKRPLDVGHLVIGIGMTLFWYIILAMVAILVLGLVEIIYWIITGGSLREIWFS